MQSSRLSTVLIASIYIIAIMLALISILGALGFHFADSTPAFPLAEISIRIVYIATVLLVTQAIAMPLVTLLQIARLREYLPYFIISIIGIAAYIVMWICSEGKFRFLM